MPLNEGLDSLALHCFPAGHTAFSFMPGSIYFSQSFKNLALVLQGGLVHFPASASTGFCNLQSLTLDSVTMCDTDFGDWISYSCNQIKVLELREIIGIRTINIKSSTLEKLLDYDSIRERCETDWHVKGDAPVFEYPVVGMSRWDGYPICCHYLPSMIQLQEVAILLQPNSSSLPDIRQLPLHFNLLGFFHPMHALQTVSLTAETIEALFKQGCLSKSIQLCDVSTLTTVCSNLSDGLVPALASFFQGIPNLRTLRISHGDRFHDQTIPLYNKFGFFSQFWEGKRLNFVNQLRFAERFLTDHGT